MPARSSKRQKALEPLAGLNDAEDKHQRFTRWSRDRGVQISGVKAEQLQGRGVGLVTTKALRKGDLILFIPEKAMFKPDLALLKREKLAGVSPQAQLAISAMVTFRDAESPLKLWEEVWPTASDFHKSMPMCWPKSLQQLLPPSVHQPLERQLADYQKDWDAAKPFCVQQGFSEDDFQYFWVIVNSRSFHFKPPRGKAGSMVMCPFIDYMNHGPTGVGVDVTQTAKGYEVKANRAYDAGEEILATYGAHSNDKLLVHYGFICTPTPNQHNRDDDIRLDHLIIPKLKPEIRDQLQDVGFLGAYALMPADNELCFKTQVAVRAVLLTCNEWEYFVTNGEDLSVDHSPEVKGFVKDLLAEYRSNAVQRLGEVEAQGDGTAQSLLKLRWTQIIQAIDTFSQA